MNKKKTPSSWLFSEHQQKERESEYEKKITQIHSRVLETHERSQTLTHTHTKRKRA